MIDIEDLYFEWLLTQIDPDGVTEGVAYLCDLLHNCEFHRRVGNDINRAVNGANLRKEFVTQFEEVEFAPHVTNELMAKECSWLEMLIALSRDIDFLYEGGVDGRFAEIVNNMQLGPLAMFNPNRTRSMVNRDQREVDIATDDIDHNRFTRDGHGGLFPLRKTGHPDQREVEIWDQCGAYFNERLKGVLF